MWHPPPARRSLLAHSRSQQPSPHPGMVQVLVAVPGQLRESGVTMDCRAHREKGE